MRTWNNWFCIVFFIILYLAVIIAVVLVSGCHTWQGFQQDLGFHKPESKPEVAPSPTVQLWKAAKNSNWLVTVSILGIAISTAAFVNGSKAALPIGMGSLAALGMTLATIRYSQWIALCSFVAAMLIFFATVLKKNTALKQIIIGVQELKSYIGAGAKEIANRLLSENQNKDTTKLVLNEKANLKLAGKI